MDLKHFWSCLPHQLLSNQPWYMLQHKIKSVARSRGGGSNSLANLNSPVQRPTIYGTKIRDLPLMTVSLSLAPLCLWPPCILIWASSTIPFQAEIQRSLGFICRGHSLKDKFFCFLLFICQKNCEQCRNVNLGGWKRSIRVTFLRLTTPCVHACAIFPDFLPAWMRGHGPAG